jgi:hypothetical protein
MDDWGRESGAMASIYQNAYLTIAATASSDANGGCFTMPSHQIHDAHKIVTDAYKIAVADLDGKPIEVYARKPLEHFSSHIYSTEEELRRFIKSFHLFHGHGSIRSDLCHLECFTSLVMNLGVQTGRLLRVWQFQTTSQLSKSRLCTLLQIG